MTPLAWCVSGYESGHGANVSNGVDFGWFQFAPETYRYALGLLAADGVVTSDWDPNPLTAPVWQQTAAFNRLWPLVTDTTAGWPATGARCIAEGYATLT